MSPSFPDIALRAKCVRFLGGHGPSTARDWITRLATSPALDDLPDVYSEGAGMQRLEAEVAGLLGKPAALFFHKGVTAQQAALLVHAGVTGRRVVALHSRSHLALDESDTLDRLAGLVSRRVGSDLAPFGVADLVRVAEPLAAVTVEVPLRRAGFLGTSWDELVGISAWARAAGVPFHLDAARIWEMGPWYGRSLAEIAALSDSVYVSFYKGLGGMGGCVLAGSPEFIAACRPWRNRFGGDLPTIFPYVVSALDGLKAHLPRMTEYYEHARAIAAAINARPGVRTFPEAPHGNSFRVVFEAPVARLEAAATAIAQERGVWLFNRFEALALPSHSFGEVVSGAATLGWSPDAAADAVAEVARRAAV